MPVKVSKLKLMWPQEPHTENKSEERSVHVFFLNSVYFFMQISGQCGGFSRVSDILFDFIILKKIKENGKKT